MSFVSGRHGTVTALMTESQSRKVVAVQTLSNDIITGDAFVLAAGAWSSSLVPMYNTTLSTAQVLAFVKLDETEKERYRNLPIYMNFSSKWFCFPPHPATGHLEFVIYGLGYTRTTEEKSADKDHNDQEQNSSLFSRPLSTPL